MLERWHLSRAALVGFLVGAVAFIVIESYVGSLDDRSISVMRDVLEYGVITAVSVAIAIAVTAARNRWIQR